MFNALLLHEPPSHTTQQRLPAAEGFAAQKVSKTCTTEPSVSSFVLLTEYVKYDWIACACARSRGVTPTSSCLRLRLPISIKPTKFIRTKKQCCCDSALLNTFFHQQDKCFFDDGYILLQFWTQSQARCQIFLEMPCGATKYETATFSQARGT